MSDGERKRVPDHRSVVVKESLPQDPCAHPRNTQGQSIRDRTKRARRKVDMEQLGVMWRSCIGDNLEADESIF